MYKVEFLLGKVSQYWSLKDLSSIRQKRTYSKLFWSVIFSHLDWIRENTVSSKQRMYQRTLDNPRNYITQKMKFSVEVFHTLAPNFIFFQFAGILTKSRKVIQQFWSPAPLALQRFSLTPDIYKDVTHNQTNLQLSAAGLFEYVWLFSGYHSLTSWWFAGETYRHRVNLNLQWKNFKHLH